LVIR
jgi:Ca2+ transporting ATPase